MAVSTTNYFSNSIVGVPQVGGDVDIYAVHSAPKFAIGTKFERQDGAIFRYAHLSAATTSGVLVSTTLSDAFAAMVTSTNAASSTYQSEGDPKGTYPSAVGSKYVIATMASVTKNQYAGGVMVISRGTGSAYTYRIRGNDATSTTASGLVKFELYDRLAASLDTSSVAAVVGSKYQDLQLAAANTDAGIAVGATINTFSTSYTWGWIQTKGYSGVKVDGLNTLANSVGYWAVLSTAGAVVIATAATLSAGTVTAQPIIGQLVSVASSGAVGIVDLRLD